jgi:hypothetical protein
MLERESPYHTVHLQKGVFAASNPIVTRYHAYFDKISSKHQMNSNKESNHSTCSGDGKTTGDFISSQTQRLTKPIYFSRLTQQLGLGLAP